MILLITRVYIGANSCFPVLSTSPFQLYSTSKAESYMYKVILTILREQDTSVTTSLRGIHEDKFLQTLGKARPLLKWKR